MHVEELEKISETLRSIFLPINEEKYDWKTLVFNGRMYFFNLVCNWNYGFITELMYSNCSQMLRTLYYKDAIIFKHLKSNNRAFAEARSVKLLKDDHFYKYLNWSENDFLDYIKFLKLYTLEKV